MVLGENEDSLRFLSAEQRQTVRKNMKEIAASSNQLYIGKRILELQVILAPYGYFTKAIAAMGLVLRTGYACMYAYRHAMENLPEGAVQAMMDRKLVINASRAKGALGEWTKPVAAVPPPAKGTPETYRLWVERMITAKPKRMTGSLANRVKKNPDDALLETFKFIARISNRLPDQPEVRRRFALQLIRLVMAHFNLAAQKVSPRDVPPEFVPRTQFSALPLI